MKITRTTKKGVASAPPIAELIDKLLQTPTDELPQVLSQIEVWKWPRSDLNAWISVLDKFDAILEDIILEYDVERLQIHPFASSTKKVVCAILRFERLLLENSTNRKMYNSYDRLNHLLSCSDLDIVILSLNVLLRPAQQYSAQTSVNHALNISTPRLLSLSRRLPHLREHGISLVDLATGANVVDGLHAEAREVNFNFYKQGTDLNNDKENNEEMDKDRKMDAESSHSPLSSQKATFIPGSGSISIRIEEQEIATKSVMDALADVTEHYAVPGDEKFELMCRIRAAKSLTKGREADRVKLVTIRLLAIAIYGHTHVEAQATTSLFLYEPDLISHIAELLQIDRHIPVRIQTAAIAALDSLARYRSKHQEVLTALNAGVNHGVLMALVRKTIADVADPESSLPQSFTDALLSFVTFLTSHTAGGNMVVGAGLIPLLVQVIDNKLSNRLPVLSKTMQLMDNILYGYTNAFNIFCTAHGVEALVNRIEYEVNLAINTTGERICSSESVASQGELPISRSAALKHILRSMHRMMQSSGTAEGLRGLIDMSLLKSIKIMMQNRSLFGPNVLPLAINIMTTFVHNEPTSLGIIQEAGLPEVFYSVIEAGLEPAIEIIQAATNAVGALCLNEVGQTQLAHRPSIIPGIFSVFTSERHLKVLLDKENAVLVGTAVDELIRHHPFLKMAVFESLKSTMVKIETLGHDYCVLDESCHWYRLVPVSTSSNPVSADVAMDHVEDIPVPVFGDRSDDTEQRFHESVDDGQEEKLLDNMIVSFIDVLGRFLEGLFQHTPHCRDFVNLAEGLALLGRLTSLPCLPYNFANSVASDSMVQVMRTMTEVVTDQTLSHLVKLVGQSLEDTRSFWDTVEESSKLLQLVELCGNNEEKANYCFRDLVTLHIRITLLSDVFSTAGYAHGRTAFGLLQTLMANMSSDVTRQLGALHRATIWENILLNVGLTSKGIEVKATPPSSPLSRSPNRSPMNLPDGDTTHNIAVELMQVDREAVTSTTSTRLSSKQDAVRRWNSLALKHITHGLPSALAPFFQAIVKMFNIRRNLDPSQKRQIIDSSKILADVMVNHLSIRCSVIPSMYAYYTVMLGLYTLLLVDERTSTHNLHTVQLFYLYRAGGLNAILDVCGLFASTIERIIRVKEDDMNDAEKKELYYAYGGIKVALHLLRPIVSCKPIHESGQTVVLVTRDRKDTDPDYFEPHNFLVKMRMILFPLLRGLWDAPWLLSAPLNVIKSIVKPVLELVNSEGEEPRGDAAMNETQTQTVSLSRNTGPDEHRIQVLMDMGFPRSAAERALIRTGNNINAATDHLLSHPFPFPTNTEINDIAVTVPQPSTTHDEAASSHSVVSGDPSSISDSVTESEKSEAEKTAEQWKKDLDEAREDLRNGFSRRALLLIDEHISLLFELHVVFVRPNDGCRQLAVQELVDDVKTFSSHAYDVQEQPLANRCRLIALILSESPSLFTAEMRTTLLGSLLDLLLSCVEHPDHPPRWLAAHLLVTEALFTLAAEPRVITLPKEGELIVSEVISVGPALTEAKSIVFDFILRLLDTPNLPSDEFLSVLRLFIFLSRDKEMASQFLKREGIAALLKRIKESAVFGSSAYIAIVLRHLVEDEKVIQSIMQQTIKRYFSQPRTRTIDVSTYVRNCSALALRDPELFIEVTSSLCELGHPFTAPTIGLKKKPKVSDKTTPGQDDLSSAMQVDPPILTSILQSTASSVSSEYIVHSLIGELMTVMKALDEVHMTSAQLGASLPLYSGSLEQPLSTHDHGRQGSCSQESKISLNDYVCFIMQSLSELLFSYDSCKLAFLSYSPKKKNQTPAKDTNRFRMATLHFLLSDLVTFGTINPQPDDRARTRINLCNWAMSVIVALCVDSTPHHEAKEVSLDLISVRKFVLEAVSRTIKDLPTTESTEARYGRLLALADLCHRLLTVKFNAASRKSTDENPTHIAKVMLEKNFVSTLTTALSEIDLNYPNVRGLVPSILRPIEHLTKIAIKMSRTSTKHKESIEGTKFESESSFGSNEEEDDDGDGDDDDDDDDRQETPDLYRNSALGMFSGEMDDTHFNGDNGMDEDEGEEEEEEEEEDVEMDFAEETGSDDTSNTNEIPEENVEDEPHDMGGSWREDDEDEDLVENVEEEEEGDEDGARHAGDDYGDDVVWQNSTVDDGVRLGGASVDDDEEGRIIPIQIVREDDMDDNLGSDEEEYMAENTALSEDIFAFEDALMNAGGRAGGGGVFISRRRDAGDDNIQVFGRARSHQPTPPTTHPLLLDTSASQPRPHTNPPRNSRHSQRSVIPNGSVELLQTIDDLIGGGAVQLFQHIMSRGRITGGPDIRVDIPHRTIFNIGQNFPQRRTSNLATSVRVEPQQNAHEDRIGRELEPLFTSQRWAQEVKILNGEFVPERLGKLTNHLILALLPAAIEAMKEEQELAAQREATAEKLAASPKMEPEGLTEPPAGEVLTSSRELNDQTMEEGSSVAVRASASVLDTAMEVEMSAVSGGPSQETGPSTVISTEMSGGPASERITVMIHGSAVDITETGIDPTFLEALPDDMREEVLNQHVREQRAARVERPADSQISTEFLDALPPEIRAEIIQQEALQRAQTREGGPTDMDNATFIASLDPLLRQTVLMEQDEVFIQTLPSHMLAELGAYRENQQRQSSTRASTRILPSSSMPMRKIAFPSDAIQLLDKPSIGVLVRLLFFPHVAKKTLLFKVLLNLCENAKTRTELFNLLLCILQDGTGDLTGVDKSFSQLSFRNTKPPSKFPAKQKLGTEHLPISHTQGEAVPDLIAQRCLEALTYIVGANESSSLFFLTEHELPISLRRTVAKKGKGKEKQVPQTHYPVVLLLGLLDRQSLLKTPAIMESVVGLLATVTRPLAGLKDPTKETLPEASAFVNAAAIQSQSSSSPSAPMEFTDPAGATVSSSTEAPESTGTVAAVDLPEVSSPQILTTVKQSTEAVEEKNFLANPPQIPHAVLRLIVNILTVGECSGKTFQQSLALIQHLSYIPDAQDIIAQELKIKAQEAGQNLSSDLDELVLSLQDPERDSLISSIAAKFSPASSVQAKLLRVLKTIDYMYTPKTLTPVEGVSTDDDVRKVQRIYESFQFSGLWRRLGNCLSIIQERPSTEHVATVLLPLIEALMVVCKYVSQTGANASRALHFATSPRSPISEETMEDLFVMFTDKHRKILNLMVRNNPSLMSGSFSLLVHNPRVLDFDNKRNYFNQQLHRRPQTREHYGTLQLNVRRARVFEDSFQHLQRKTGDQIKYGKLSIRFYDEEGVDAGGVTREWFQILARQMFDPNNALFQPCAADKLTYQPNKNSWVNPEHLSFFKFVGRIIGKAIFDGRLLDAYFARSLYRQLLGKPVDYRDVEWVDPEYYNSLCWILENDPSVLDLTFSVEADEFGVNKIVPLKEGGEITHVTQDNKKEFVQLSAQYRLYSSIEKQIENLLNGFYEIIPKDLVTIFNEQELELLISGTPDIDVDEWRAATEYNGYTSSDPNIVWWWRALKSFNRDERAKVLSFATGTSRVPLSGFVDLQGVQGVQRFSIHKAYGASDRLPQAHTCFNQIDLPQYSSYEMLRQQLLLAINEGGEGFAFS